MAPLAGARLMPHACAEVIGYQKPGARTKAPAWYAGNVIWSDRRVPVSFEGALGLAPPLVSSRTRIAR